MTTPDSGGRQRESQRPFWLYLLECEDGTLYTGIARDPEARFWQHASGQGAAYTRAHPPRRLVALRELPSMSDALKAEYALKQVPRARKLQFFSANERIANVVDGGDTRQDCEPAEPGRMRPAGQQG